MVGQLQTGIRKEKWLMTASNIGFEYTGCYKITLEDGTIINIEAEPSGTWTEKGKGATELADSLGKIIEHYKE